MKLGIFDFQKMTDRDFDAFVGVERFNGVAYIGEINLKEFGD